MVSSNTWCIVFPEPAIAVSSTESRTDARELTVSVLVIDVLSSLHDRRRVLKIQPVVLCGDHRVRFLEVGRGLERLPVQVENVQPPSVYRVRRPAVYSRDISMICSMV